MKKVLIIDDDKIIRLLLAKLLNTEGFDVIFADDGATGLEKILSGEVDIILMDYNLGEMTALDLLNLMKKNNISKPVVLVSAFDKKDIEKTTKLFGVNEIVQKPFTNKELVETVKKIIN